MSDYFRTREVKVLKRAAKHARDTDTPFVLVKDGLDVSSGHMVDGVRQRVVITGAITGIRLTCPICAAANDKLGIEKWSIEAHSASHDAELGLSGEGINRIMGAADHSTHPLRPALLELLEVKT